jgi:predicted metal-binding membrane protein
MSAGDPLGKSRSRSADRRQLTAVVLVVSVVAWLAMLLLHGGAAGNSHSFHYPPMGANIQLLGRDWLPFVQWLSGWLIMVVAMMLPPALPFLQAMQKLTEGLPSDRVLVAAAAAAFIAAWTVAGVVLVVAGNLITSLLANIPWLAESPTLISGIAAILVGVYQLSPLKQACLTACRSPTALMIVAWDDSQPWRSALTIGVRYGFICIGCCWTLMLLTLVVGAFVLPLMVVVSLIMLLERLLPSVRSLVPLQAVIACAIGVLLLIGSLPPGLNIGGSGTAIHHSHHHTGE